MTDAEIEEIEKRAEAATDTAIGRLHSYAMLLERLRGKSGLGDVEAQERGVTADRAALIAAADEMKLVTAALREARRVLRDNQWVIAPDNMMRCPTCRALMLDGHAPACALAAAIGEGG